MTNRDRYILQKNSYDMMLTISKIVCPIWVITGKEPIEWNNCPHAANNWYEWEKGVCEPCIQAFLNRESED